MSLSTDREPHYGARFELSLQTVEAERVCYAARVHLPAGHRDYNLAIALPEGTCTVVEVGGEHPGVLPETPSWVRAHLLTLGRQLYRDGRAGAWLRRLMRWRGAPESG